MLEHLLIVALFVSVIPVGAAYTPDGPNDASTWFHDGSDILDFILDTVSVTVLILLVIVLVGIGVVIFFLCQCSPMSTARSYDDNEYKYHLASSKIYTSLGRDVNSNRRNMNQYANGRMLTSIMENHGSDQSIV